MDHPEKQIDKFKDATKEVGPDIDGKDFDEALGKLAKSEPPPKEKKSDEKRPAK